MVSKSLEVTRLIAFGVDLFLVIIPQTSVLFSEATQESPEYLLTMPLLPHGQIYI